MKKLWIRFEFEKNVCDNFYTIPFWLELFPAASASVLQGDVVQVDAVAGVPQGFAVEAVDAVLNTLLFPPLFEDPNFPKLKNQTENDF